MSLIRAKISSASALELVGERLDVPGAAERVGDVGDAGLLHQHLLRAQRDLGGLLRRQREHLVEGVGVQRVGAAEHGGERLDGCAHDVVVRLLRGERNAGRLGVEPQPLRALVGGAVHVAQPTGPDAPRCAELRDLLEEVDVRVEEERQARREPVDVEAARETELDVAEPVGEGERQLLRSGRAGLADVVARHGQRLVTRSVRRLLSRNIRQMRIRIAEEKIRISALERMEPLLVRRRTGGALRGTTGGSTR